MGFKSIRSLLAAGTLAAGLASGASAATLFTDTFNFAPQAGWSVPSSANADFLGRINNSAPAPFNVTGVVRGFTATVGGLGELKFDLLAFNSLDDNNCCLDTLSVIVNGSTIATGFFAGYRDNASLVTSPTGSSLVSNGVVSVVGGNGQNTPRSYTVNLPVTLLAGANTFGFTYTPLQDYFDESWGLDNVMLYGPDQGGTTVIPLPAAAWLFGAGLAALGFRVRRRT